MKDQATSSNKTEQIITNGITLIFSGFFGFAILTIIKNIF